VIAAGEKLLSPTLTEVVAVGGVVVPVVPPPVVPGPVGVPDEP
jgi:hypothetical protein